LLETQTNRVYLSNFEISALTEVIAYAYSGSISFNVNNVQNVFVIASLLNLKQVQNAASDYMESKLDMSNAIEIYGFARQHMCDYLEEKSRDFINRYFVDIAKTSEFNQFSNVAFIIDLLSSDDLDVANEEFLFATILKWIEHDYASRCEHFESLFLKCIRLSLIEPAKVDEIFVKYQSIIFQSETCLRIIRDYIAGKSADSNQTTLTSVAKRSGMVRAEQCFILIGGNCDNDEGCYVNCFNPFNGDKYFLSKNFLEKSKFMTKGYFHIENPGVCVTNDNRIFVAGGVYVYHEYKLYNLNRKAIKPFKKSPRVLKKSETDEFPTMFDGQDSLKNGLFFSSKFDNIASQKIERSNLFSYNR
jgi:hypothetical protein